MFLYFQGGNKRPGAFAIYLEPWHADIFAFLDLRKNHGKEEQVCTQITILHSTFFENLFLLCLYLACSRSFPGFVGSGLVHETCQRIRRLVFNVPQ